MSQTAPDLPLTPVKSITQISVVQIHHDIQLWQDYQYQMH